MEDFREAKSADIIYDYWNVFVPTPRMWYLLGRERQMYELITNHVN